MDAVRRRWLARLPDRPLWVETRDLLSWAGSRLIEHPTRTGFVVWSAEDGIGSVVGEPDPPALAEAAGDVPELLAFADNVDRVRSLLPGFVAEPATIFADPGRWPPPPPHRCRELGPRDIAALDHLPDDLLEQLADAADDGASIVAAFDGALPVAFAYVAAETASLWDVSIDTIPSHRRRGYAAAAALHLMRGMREKGKTAVWGALDSNPASANLARRLGFVESDRLWVLTRRDGATPGAGGGPLRAQPRQAEDDAASGSGEDDPDRRAGLVEHVGVMDALVAGRFVHVTPSFVIPRASFSARTSLRSRAASIARLAAGRRSLSSVGTRGRHRRPARGTPAVPARAAGRARRPQPSARAAR